ncbi:MAG: ATP-binding protein [Micromonosporaceae bacterium]
MAAGQKASAIAAEENRQALVAALGWLRNQLGAHAGGGNAGHPPGPAPPCPALDALAATFSLSPFERAILLLCAGVDLDAGVAAACAAAQADPARPQPTFGLALATLPEPHWSALGPDAPLRHWHLVEVGQAAGTPLTACPLRIDEHVLHLLAGIHHLDERLAGLIEPVADAAPLVGSHTQLARRVASVWSRSSGSLPAIVLTGNDAAAKRDIAAAACAQLGLSLVEIGVPEIPATLAGLLELLRFYEREAALTGTAIYADADELDPGSPGQTALVRLVERVPGPVLIGVGDGLGSLRRAAVQLDVRHPTPAEQRELWLSGVGDAAAGLDGQVDALAAQFDLSGARIRASVSEALAAADDGAGLARALWDAGRTRARASLDDLAQRIEPVATWHELVLPDESLGLLHELANQVRHRATVYQRWGFGAAGQQGLGISALFTGPSGTGKTMAAEVLADEMQLDLFRIDLSGVVSKYIGETEKNLRRVFGAAEEGGALLFFDEADALFGKRSEVKDSHDRYANIEVNYLLQRMEAYRGVAVLATNLKGALDPAFLRRIRFVVSFPVPNAARRADIWRRVFPAAAPTAGLDPERLAQLTVVGGNIRNIAVNAAFMAAGADEPLTMRHLLRAARMEFAKLERPFPEEEVRGWV